ncbi:unnamed protein product [Heligmosomoides polygyrus]|uniref:Reverse transcriptase domain-containing protein n=1 Tax=Heligmosomoides polygyrus TaxID=6339 RepID=A0A183GU18_HELPZ|nr:unnamed protein product [Heligmosomoides polygyrus]
MARGAKGDFGRASPELLEGLKVGQLRAMYTIKGMEEKYSRFEEREAKYDVEKPVSWTLLYADDVMLIDKGELERQVQAWCDRLETFGLKLDVRKTE